MKTKFLFVAIFLATAVTIITSCNKKDDLAGTAKEVYLDLPSSPYQYFSSNSNEMITLGRVLFYDPRLSVNHSISCASCHKQALAFSDNTAFSRGFQNRLTSRNALPVQNLISNSFFGESSFLFWDGRERFLNSMVVKPILNHVEME